MHRRAPIASMFGWLWERENMRSVENGSAAIGPKGLDRSKAKPATPSFRSAELIPLYNHEQFLFLVERERARADRAAARPPKAPRKRHAPSTPAPTAKGSTATAPSAAPPRGQPKPSSEGVWGATTDNREFSLVIFRPRERSDRPGLVELLQCCVRTTDAVGIIDTRRLGVLLPDTAAGNAIHFVKKVLTLAQEQGVHLSHIVHTYPAAWPDEHSPMWNEPKRQRDDQGPDSPAKSHMPQRIQRTVANRGMVRGLVNWLQAAAFRRPVQQAARASG
jgi:hypothetical protein